MLIKIHSQQHTYTAYAGKCDTQFHILTTNSGA